MNRTLRSFILFVAASVIAVGTVVAEPSEALPKEVVINDVELVLIPGGWFWYSVPNRYPKTGHTRGNGPKVVKTWVDSYYLAKYEARARHFRQFMNSGKSRHAAEYDGLPGFPESGAEQGCTVRKGGDGSYFELEPDRDLPATHLSWNIANEWATSLDFRLPTEAEWVRAFRGDDKRVFPWGNEYPDDTYAGFEEGGTECNVRPVTAFPKGQSPYGVYNMAGNVYEYVADWFNLEHHDRLKDGVRNPVSTEPYLSPDIVKPQKLLRGGRWASGPTELSINGNSAKQPPDELFRCLGVRFAADLATVRRHLAAGTAKVVR